MRRIIRLSVSVALVGVWLATAIPAQAATPSAAAAAKGTKAKPVTSQHKASPVKPARIFTPKLAHPKLPPRTPQWWKKLKRTAVKAKPRLAVVPLSIGVDNATPAGHNWAYVAFFPEANVNVHAGDTLDFHWNAGSSFDALHTVTFFPGQPGTTVAAFRAANPVVVPEPGGDEAGFLENNNVFLPHPEPTAGPPCGFVEFGATPCVFDNTLPFVSSGGVPGGNPSVTGAPSHFQVTISPATPLGTYTYACLIHPNMNGQITVVAPATAPTTQAEADAASKTQYDTLTAGAGPVEAAALHPTSTIIGGVRTWNQNLGVSADDVEILEMLPPTLPISAGDAVKFVNPTTSEVHTATFPLGPAGFALAPFGQPQCEGTPDTPAPGPGRPPSGCANFAAYEAPINPAPQGAPSTITSGATGASTGVLFPGGSNMTYSFPKNGTYTYFCFFHSGMVGAVYTPHYRQTATDGGEFTFGGADYFGSEGNITLNKPVIGQAETSDAQGYWQVATDGGVFTHGDAGYFGSKGGQHLNQPIVGITPTPDNGGYTMVASDGGIFTFGDAQYFGSMGGHHLNKPIVGIASTPDGGGYWEVASDGGVFNFGDAGYFGSLGAIHLNKPIVGVTSGSFGGYTMVASDGGVFNFGDAGFFGSMGGTHLNQPVVGIALTIDGGGYREVASDGGIFTFGDAGYFGSMGGTHLNQPIVGLSAA